MSIATIGAGRMGRGLARRLAAAGEAVTITGRDVEKVAALAEDIPGDVSAGPIAGAANADVVFLAVPYGEVAAAVAEAGSLAGKILVDITNPIGPDFSLAVGMTTSGAEEIHKLVPQARLVKAFNTIFSDVLDIQLSDPDTPPQVLYAGDHEFANQRVEALITAMGFAPLAAGPLENARLLEPIGLMTIQLGMKLGHGRRVVPRFVEY